MQKPLITPIWILFVCLTVGMFCSTGVWSAEPAAETPEAMQKRLAREAMLKKQETQTAEMKAAMEAEGYTRENNHLRGQSVTGPGEAVKAPYPAEYFPHAWDFDGGALCGITESNGMTGVAVSGGALKFAVADTNAYFSWGDFAAGQAGLRFGYARNQTTVAPLGGFLVRLRQSQPQSAWQVSTRSLNPPDRGRSGLGRDTVSDPVMVTGTVWQTVEFPCAFRTAGRRWAEGPWTGFRLISSTPGNQVEIDWIRPYSPMTGPLFRRTLTLAGDVRWAKCSIVAGYDGRIKLYVNGKVAVDREVSREQLWNFDLDPALFHRGENVIAYVPTMMGGSVFLLDGALLCQDGSYQRFDSDASWKCLRADKVMSVEDPRPALAWTMPGYDDTAWKSPELLAKRPRNVPTPDNEWALRRQWFNPSWKGRLMVAPADGRLQPVFGSKDEVALNVAWPVSQGEAQPEISWQVFDEMGDGFHAADKLVAEGKLELKNQKSEIRNQKCADYVGELKFPAGKLPCNVAYAVVLRAKVGGQEVEKWRYEIAVCGPVNQPVVDDPKDVTDGMKLKLVWEVDAAADPKADEFISIGGASNYPSAVITTPLGKFRQPYAKEMIHTVSRGGGYANFVSWKYRVEHLGKPHLAIGEYPDDTERAQEMRLTEGQWLEGRYGAGDTELGNHTAVLGVGNPLTHELRRHTVLFWPSQPTGAVSVMSVQKDRNWTPEKAARIGKIRIYEILNDVPMRRIADAPGPKKWIGQQPERGPRIIFLSCFSSPVNSLIRENLYMADAPNFYRNWMVTYLNMIKRLRFGGENAYFCGQYMYAEVMSPSVYADSARQLRVGGSLRDYGVLMGRMFDENGMGFFTATELCWLSHLQVACSDDDVARGVETAAQVYRDGHQGNEEGMGLTPNWLHPTVRKYVETLVDEWATLYGKEPGWKGMMMYLDTANGPSWAIDQDPRMDPYATSYDDYTIGLFEKEAGVKIPVDAKDPKRFTKRYDWLMANAEAKEKWTDWRCRKMTEIYGWIGDRLKKERKDLRLILSTAIDAIGVQEQYAKKVKSPNDLVTYSRSAGLDLAAIRKRGDITLAMVRVGNVSEKDRYLSRRDNFMTAVANDGVSGLNHRVGWIESQPNMIQDWVFDYTATESYLDFPAEYFADTYVNQFIRANPAIMLRGLQDVVMWNGHEFQLARFAAAFRSLPAARYTKLAGNGRDVNVWCSAAEHDGAVYAYVANPQWWELDAEVTFAPGAKADDLIAGKAVAGTSWKGRLAPYTIQTFRIGGVSADAALTACTTVASQRGRDEVARQLAETKAKLDKHRKLLEAAGVLPAVEAVAQSAEAAVARNDYSTAQEQLTAYPDSAFNAVAEQAFGPFLVDGWKYSRLIPKDKTLDQAPYVKSSDDLGWKPYEPPMESGGMVNMNPVFGEVDGLIYMVNRIKVPTTTSWIIGMGHDGGAKVFVDGKPVYVEPKLKNPCRPDRAKIPIELTAGEHEIQVVFDTYKGEGWGIRFRFRAPEGQPRIQAEYPVTVSGSQSKAEK